MIIVKNMSEGNEIKFIPREGKINKVVLTDEVTGEVTEEALSFTTEGYYSVCTIQTDLVNHRKYNLKVIGDDGEVLYNDLVFCSTQENEEYSINNEEVDFTAAPAQDSPKFITV